MPDSNNQHSASDSVIVKSDDKTTISTNGHTPSYTNGKNGTVSAYQNGSSNNGHTGIVSVNGNKANGTAPLMTYRGAPKKQALNYQRLPDFSQAPSPEESTVKEAPKRSRSLRMQWRFFRTLIFAAWLFARILFWQVYVAKYVPGWVDRTNMGRWKKYAREFRGFAIQLGGVYIKLGQFISTRVDILPEEIIEELASLQDEVPTIKFSKIQSVIEGELGAIEKRYSEIDPDPIAAASLGQVHRAKLLSGEKVVVKVQRPGIREICYTDLAAMRIVGRVANRFRFMSRRADSVALVEEFGKVLLEELSYKHEAYNATRFAKIFEDNTGVYIPAVYYEHSTDRALTIEDVTSIKITDYEAIEKAGISREAVARRLMDTYLPQVFENYFFHADPHPGNLFIYPLPVEDENADFGADGRPFYLIFVDFGMTGTLTHEIADGIVNTMQAVLTRDAKRLIESYVKLGFILPGADLLRIEEAARATFDQVWGLNMTDLKNIDYQQMADLAEEFNDLIFSMPFYIPQDFIYLGRTIGILSGMCTSMYPPYNPWNELQPYTEKLVAKGFGINIKPGTLVIPEDGKLPSIQALFSGNGRAILLSMLEVGFKRFITTMSRAESILQRLEDGNLRVTADLSVAHRQQLKRIELEQRKGQRTTFISAVLISATLLYVGGETTLAHIGFGFVLLVIVLNTLRD